MADNGQWTIDHAMIRRLLFNVQRHIAEWPSCESYFRHTVRAVSWRPAPRDGRERREKREFLRGLCG